MGAPALSGPRSVARVSRGHGLSVMESDVVAALQQYPAVLLANLLLQGLADAA